MIHDVLVIGGGAAGLTAATLLARSRRTVLVLDAGRPRNAAAAGVHLFLGHDGVAPGELLEAGRREVTRYGGVVRTAEALTAATTGDGFAVTLAGGEIVRGRRLLVTTGLRDELPDIPGVRERWGRDVVHCPYCHGWEIRDRAIGVLGDTAVSMQQALMFRQLSDDVTVFLQDTALLNPTLLGQFRERGVGVVEGTVTAVEVGPDGVRGVRLDDGQVIPRTAMAVLPRSTAASPVLDGLGLKPVPFPAGERFGEYYDSDPNGATSVPGLWLAGNVRDLTAQVVTAAAQGMAAGAAINGDLIFRT